MNSSDRIISFLGRSRIPRNNSYTAATASLCVSHKRAGGREGGDEPARCHHHDMLPRLRPRLYATSERSSGARRTPHAWNIFHGLKTNLSMCSVCVCVCRCTVSVWYE